MTAWRTVGAVAAVLALAWAGLMVTLWILAPRKAERGRLRQSLRVLPDVVRLLRRLATDRDVPRGARVRIWLLMAYLLCPIDLVPDFVPVIGHLDDLVVAALALRSVVRRAGRDAVRRHWPGTPDGLAVVWRLAGVTADS